MLKFCTLSILLCLFIPAHGTVPGTIVRVKQEALQYACQTGRAPLQQALRVIPIPDFVGRPNPLGSLLKIVGIRILNVQLPRVSVKLVPNVGVQVSVVSDLHIGARLILVPVELRVGTSILLDVRVLRTAAGFPVLKVSACKSLLGDVKIILGGTNLLGFLNPLQSHLRAILVDQMCLSISSTLLQLNARLGTLVGLNSFSSVSQLHYTMIEPPVITGDYIDLDLNSSGSGDSMVVLGISEHLLNSVLAMAQQFGSFNFHVFRQTSASIGHLTTSRLGSFIPAIAHQFPRPEPVGLKVTVSKAPIVTFFEGRAILSLHPSVEVVASSSSWTSASQSLFTLDVDVALVLHFAVTEVKLQASVSLQGGLRFVLVSSRVGSVKVSRVACLIASAFEEALVARLNAVLSVGINLPRLNNIKYAHPHAEVHKGYAAVSCGLDYEQ